MLLIDISFAGEGQFNLTEDQIRALATGQLTEADLQALVAQSQLSSNELQEQVTNGDHGDMAIHMTEEHKQVSIFDALFCCLCVLCGLLYLKINNKSYLVIRSIPSKVQIISIFR